MNSPEGDPEPWRHDWAGLVSRSDASGITPSAQMMWTGGNWRLTCRWGVMNTPDMIVPALRWLGPYLIGGYRDRFPVFLGYIDCDVFVKPVLLWLMPGSSIEATFDNLPTGRGLRKNLTSSTG